MHENTRIYIVDDDPEVLEAITHLLSPTGARIETFSRADDFFRAYRAVGPACLVLDVRMPGMSGLELQAHLVEAGCEIPIIFITGHADVKMAVDAMMAGAVNFLEKPFRPQELFDEIQKALRADEDAWKRCEEEESMERKFATLKPGERDVLDLIALGKTNEEIAGELHLSVRGVEARRAKVMSKLHLHTKHELLQLVQSSNFRRREVVGLFS